MRNIGFTLCYGRATLSLTLFWLLAIGVLTYAAQSFLAPKPAKVSAEGVLTVARAPDGHFHMAGTVAGQPVEFLVDTGASLVVIPESLAQSAGLTGGEPTLFGTANGPMQGRVVAGVPVSLSAHVQGQSQEQTQGQNSKFEVSAVKVGVGLVGLNPKQALLGQSFLRHFDMQMQGNTLTLRALKHGS